VYRVSAYSYRETVQNAVDHVRHDLLENDRPLYTNPTHTDDDDRGRDVVEPENDVVRVEDRAPVERDLRRSCRLRARRDEDVLGRQLARAAGSVDHGHAVRVDEPSRSFDKRHVVPHELVADAAPVAVDDLPCAPR